MKDDLARTPWAPPFVEVGGEDSTALEKRLAVQSPPGHVLYGALAKVIRRRIDNYDVAFILDNSGEIAVTHLTCQKAGEDPRYPWTEIFPSLDQWIALGLAPDCAEFDGQS